MKRFLGKIFPRIRIEGCYANKNSETQPTEAIFAIFKGAVYDAR